MLGLRLERLAASLILSSLLLIPRGAVSDALADADKHAPNVETVRPPAEGDSQPATVHSVGSDAKTAPIPSTISAPAADDKPGDSTANDKADESSNLAGVATTAGEVSIFGWFEFGVGIGAGVATTAGEASVSALSESDAGGGVAILAASGSASG